MEKINKTKYQSGEEKYILRSRINPAPYNPRVIGEDAEKRLRKKIKQVGLFGTFIWNEKTGNLVSGHQRLNQLDKLERYPDKVSDYEIRVTVVSIDEKTEMEMNVFMNNPSTQGEWDIEALGKMSLDFDFDLKSAGFTETDIDFLFDGDSRFSEIFEDTKEVKATKEKIKEIKDHRDKSTEKLKDEQTGSFYFTVVCPSMKDKEYLMRKIGVPVFEQYVNGDLIKRKITEM
jgi:hypothetical protein